MDYRENYLSWLNNEALESSLKAELEAIAADAKEQEERFYTELEFGTAGLRGIIGAGTNRMNVHVVRRATQGLADYLNTIEGAKERGVAIAYESRHMSDVFAKETALVLAENGIKAFLYSTLHSVPQLSFTVLHLGCIAGVVITASHNPPEYNGYKVYWEHGGQVGPEQADEILKYIRNANYFAVKGMDKLYDFANRMSPLGNASADECADYCIVMFSDLTRKVTMQNLYHDGGFSSIGMSLRAMNTYQKGLDEYKDENGNIIYG